MELPEPGIMSTQATIRSIAPVKNGIGLVYREELPEGVKSLELKYCELCGRVFSPIFAPTEPILCKEREVTGYVGHVGCSEDVFEVIRRRDHGIRFCSRCINRGLQPDTEAVERYKMQLPGTERQMAHSAHLPRYDDSLNPVGRETNSHAVNKRSGFSQKGYDRKAIILRADKTRALLNAAFRDRGRLSMEELQAVIPECYSSTQVHSRLHGLAIYPRMVSTIKRDGVRGSGIGVYVLDGVSPETLQ